MYDVSLSCHTATYCNTPIIIPNFEVGIPRHLVRKSARPFKYELYSSCAPIHRTKHGLTHPAVGSSHSCWSGGATRRSPQSLSPPRFSQRPGLRSTERLWRRHRPKTGSRLRQASHAAREASDGRDGSSNAWESSMCHIGEIVGDTLCSLTKRTGDTLG